MARPSDQRLLLVHTLRLKGFVTAEAVAEASGAADDDVAAVLAELEAAGLARYREGRMTGWMLTPEGRTKGERLLGEELEAAGLRDMVSRAYDSFLQLNKDMLGLCTDWQMRDVDGEQKVNDHEDADYDAAVVDRLVAIDTQVQPTCAELAAGFDRFSSYGPRFSSSLEKVVAGDVDWFTKPMIDSYHTTWFELHENLLATLGIDRASEGHD